MKKLIIPVLATLILLVGSVSAQQLWEYGSFNERAEMAEAIGLVDNASLYTGNIMSEQMALLNYFQQTDPSYEMFGAVLPKVVALFETSLQSSITASATSMTLVTGTDKEGSTLSGVYGFIIDEGSSDEEFIIGTVAGTAVSSITRGVSVADGETSVYALIKAHRRGASVKITNAPLLMVLQRVANGDEGFPNTLFYVDGNQTIATSGDFASKKYVDDVGAGGFTASNIEPDKGLYAIGGSPETVGIDLSSLSGFRFDNDGALQIATTSGSGIFVDTDDTLKIATTSAFSFTGGLTANNATTTGSHHLAEICIANDCRTDFSLKRYAGQNTQFIASGGGEQTIYATSIPANFLGANGVIRISMTGRTAQDASSHNMYKVTLGSTPLVIASSTSSGVDFHFQAEIANRNSTNSQIGSGMIIETSIVMASSTPAAEDTTTDLDLTVSMIQVAYGTVLARVEMVLIEIIK